MNSVKGVQSRQFINILIVAVILLFVKYDLRAKNSSMAHCKIADSGTACRNHDANFLLLSMVI